MTAKIRTPPAAAARPPTRKPEFDFDPIPDNPALLAVAIELLAWAEWRRRDGLPQSALLRRSEDDRIETRYDADRDTYKCRTCNGTGTRPPDDDPANEALAASAELGGTQIANEIRAWLAVHADELGGVEPCRSCNGRGSNPRKYPKGARRVKSCPQCLEPLVRWFCTRCKHLVADGAEARIEHYTYIHETRSAEPPAPPLANELRVVIDAERGVATTVTYEDVAAVEKRFRLWAARSAEDRLDAELLARYLLALDWHALGPKSRDRAKDKLTKLYKAYAAVTQNDESPGSSRGFR